MENYKSKDCEERVLSLGCAKEIYYYALNVPGIDVDVFSRAMIKTGDAEYNYLFAKNIPNANVLEHGKVVIKRGDAKYNYLFAKNIPNANVLEHGKVVLVLTEGVCGYTYNYNYLFAKNVPGADIVAHGEAIIKSENAYDNYLFARDIPNADVLKHGEVVIKRGSSSANYYFAKDVKGSNILGHFEAIKNKYYKKDFVKNILWLDKKKYEKIILENINLFEKIIFYIEAYEEKVYAKKKLKGLVKKVCSLKEEKGEELNLNR